MKQSKNSCLSLSSVVITLCTGLVLMTGALNASVPGYLASTESTNLLVSESECISTVSANFSSDLLSVEAISDKGLSNVVLKFSDGSEQKFEMQDGQDQYSLTFSGTGSNEGKTLEGVWIKSGCFMSGDGPGYGEYIEACTAQSELRISDVMELEEPAGGQKFIFDLTLSAFPEPAACPVSVEYSTSDGGAAAYAVAVAGVDYVPDTGAVSFSNSLKESISITIIPDDDGLSEPEAFSINLSDPVNVIIADPVGLGVITEQEL